MIDNGNEYNRDTESHIVIKGKQVIPMVMQKKDGEEGEEEEEGKKEEEEE